MKKFYLRIILPAIMAILLFILTIFFILIPRYQQNIMNGKREMIKELTNSAWSILSKYEQDAQAGIITKEEAQKISISRIEYMRYGLDDKDYFWITDMKPSMVMHPFRTDLNGKDLRDFTDPHGKRLFVEFVETVKKSENGYVDYMWQWKDDSLHIVPKLSYVELFKPWGWVIGTGIYVEDVKKEISALTNRMLWISIGISIIIAFLLLYIFRQSLKIERKRLGAENDLHEAKEKFRTLVEAATEGLIMVIDGKISFSNSLISKMTGYQTTELLNLSLNEIVSKSNNEDIIEAFSKNKVKEGQFELNLNRKNGGVVESLITSSTTVFSGKEVNILIVKDISIDKSLNVTSFDYQKLINTLDIGFFKARLDSKGKFLFANETAIRILGYESLKDLSGIHFVALIADIADRKDLIGTLAENGFVKGKVLKINKPNGDFSIVALSIVALNSENPDDLVCDGIIEDITLHEKGKTQTNNLIAELKSNDFMIEQSVKDYLKPIYTLDADATLSVAIRILAQKKTESLLLTKNGKDYLGIVTNTDIQKRIMTLNLNLDNPAYLIMSSPITYISENTSVLDAITLCEEKKINHLAVKSGSGELKGMLRTNDVYKMLLNSLSFFIAKIRKAETNHDLKQCYGTLQLLLKPRIKSDVSIKYVTKITTAFSDAIIRKIIELTIDEIGQPPVNFSFLCLGSEGRKEETLFTDQDNAIIYENVSKEKELAVQAYFNNLGERVCNSLNYVGYSFCLGNIMAKNPLWCKPLETWENYFGNWIATPEPQNLLDATIFFDFRCVYGDEMLVEKLKTGIDDAIKLNPLFLYHLAFNTFNTKSPHVSAGNILSDKHGDTIDLKSALVPIIMFARTYSLQNSIWCSNTIERLVALKEKHIISDTTIDEIVFVYNFLMNLRLRNQIDLIDNNAPVSNKLNTKKLIDIELYMLKKVLSAIPACQNKIKMDFRITT
jgi:PAS domain S-box-containing protein